MNGRARGFTLMEMLVTLVVVSLATGLVTQAMRQLVRVEQLLEDGGAQAQRQIVQREWLRQLLATSLPEQTGVATRFVGSPTELQLRSAQAQDLGFGPTRTLRLSLHTEGAVQFLRLQGVAEPLAAAPAPALTLLQWSGEPGRLAYLDADGRWQDRWPAPDADPEKARRLPTLVRVDLGPAAGGSLYAKVVNGEGPRPLLSEWVER